MLSVLFVDDEPRILEGMQRMLRVMRGEWDMRFAPGGAEAIQALESARADVVVTDMRMPGVNGADLLEQVKARWPDTVRIILSGHADQELVARTVTCAHQFLSKPCDTDLLKNTILRARQLRTLVEDERIRRIAGSVDRLPSFPAAFDELNKVIANPNASVADAGAVVVRDPAMAAKLLQVVNSSFFGLRRQVVDPLEAATILGLDALRALVLAAQAFSALPEPGSHAERLWRHSMSIAGLARSIAMTEGAPKAVGDLAFMAGMLHDVGQIILTMRQPQYEHLVSKTAAHGVQLSQAEEALLGVDHGRIGGYLLGLWGLGDELVTAVVFHHRPSLSDVRIFGALAAVHAAVAFASHGDRGSLDEPFIQRIGKHDRIAAWRAAVERLDQEPE